MRGHLRMISRPYYYNCMHMTICLTASFSQCRIKKTMRIMKRTFFSIWWNTSKARQFCHHHCAAWHQQLQSLSKCVQRKKKYPKARQLCHHICAAWHQPLQSLSKMCSREEIVFFSWRPISVHEQKTGWEKFPQRWVRSVQIFCRYLYVLFIIKYIKCKC